MLYDHLVGVGIWNFDTFFDLFEPRVNCCSNYYAISQHDFIYYPNRILIGVHYLNWKKCWWKEWILSKETILYRFGFVVNLRNFFNHFVAISQIRNICFIYGKPINYYNIRVYMEYLSFIFANDSVLVCHSWSALRNRGLIFWFCCYFCWILANRYSSWCLPNFFNKTRCIRDLDCFDCSISFFNLSIYF